MLWFVRPTVQAGFAATVLRCCWTLAEAHPTLSSFFVGILLFCACSSLVRFTPPPLDVCEGTVGSCPRFPTLSACLGFWEQFVGCVVDLLHWDSFSLWLLAVFVHLNKLAVDFCWFDCWLVEGRVLLSNWRLELALFWPCTLILATVIEETVIFSLSLLLKSGGSIFLYVRMLELLEAVTEVESLGVNFLTTYFVAFVSLADVCPRFWLDWVTAGTRPVLVLTSGPRLILGLTGQEKVEADLLPEFPFSLLTTVLEKALSEGLFSALECFAEWHPGSKLLLTFSLLQTPEILLAGPTIDCAITGAFLCLLSNRAEVWLSFPTTCKTKQNVNIWLHHVYQHFKNPHVCTTGYLVTSYHHT